MKVPNMNKVMKEAHHALWGTIAGQGELELGYGFHFFYSVADVQITIKRLFRPVKRMPKVSPYFCNRKLPLLYGVIEPVSQDIAKLGTEDNGKHGSTPVLQ